MLLVGDLTWDCMLSESEAFILCFVKEGLLRYRIYLHLALPIHLEDSGSSICQRWWKVRPVFVDALDQLEHGTNSSQTSYPVHSFYSGPSE